MTTATSCALSDSARISLIRDLEELADDIEALAQVLSASTVARDPDGLRQHVGTLFDLAQRTLRGRAVDALNRCDIDEAIRIMGAAGSVVVVMRDLIGTAASLQVSVRSFARETAKQHEKARARMRLIARTLGGAVSDVVGDAASKAGAGLGLAIVAGLGALLVVVAKKKEPA